MPPDVIEAASIRQEEGRLENGRLEEGQPQFLTQPAMSPLAPVDDFQRALESDQQLFINVLAQLSPAAQHQLFPLVHDLYTILRTPIYPQKKGVLDIATRLGHAVDQGEGETHVTLSCVLASPTALQEIDAFLHCTRLFKTHGLTPQVRFLLVQWDNLIDCTPQNRPARLHSFTRQARAVHDIAEGAGYTDAVLPIALEVDENHGHILAPADFRAWSERVWDIHSSPTGKDAALMRDVTWSMGFYARQKSLCKLGQTQALLDIAIRRAIGQRVASQANILNNELPAHTDQIMVMVTSELHKRFLTCYNASLPILNIDCRSWATSIDNVA